MGVIYFCADDYGISKECNRRIEDCFKNGALNKVSILPNGEISDFRNELSGEGKVLSLHINLVEGKPLSNPDDIDLLVTENGCFKYSFVGLFLKSLSPKRRMLEKELYTELKSQIKFWNEAMSSENRLSIDSHQHTHMIPLVFKTLMRVIRDEGLKIDYIRIPEEPIWLYLSTPSLYFDYSVSGVAKQWILKVLSLINKKELKKSGISYGCFMGAMFSGRLSEKKLNTMLPRYIKLAEKKNKCIEINFHPGYAEKGELTFENRKSFEKFYLSSWRKREYDTLMKLKF